jgi:NHL repeat
MTTTNKILILALFVMLTPLAHADQGSFTNSRGSTTVSSSVIITSSVATPAGTLTLDCPTIGAGGCAGRSFSYLSDDGTTAISASFTSGTYAESCAGGGKGGHVTCGYSFSGYISGTLTVNGQAQAVTGVTYQQFGTGGAAAQGTSAYNSAYTPFYFSNSGQILRSDDLNGTNLTSYGTQGSDIGQFYGAYGIALDSTGRIYIADTYNGRVVRIGDMNGTNWTSFGTWGSDTGQFMDLSGISVDSAGRIYVMDTGNNRLVRIDDMNGMNWTTMSGIGSDVGQFAQYVAPVAFDASGRIYVADTGNQRIVRMDDMNGTNWTTLTQSPVINTYIYSLQLFLAISHWGCLGRHREDLHRRCRVLSAGGGWRGRYDGNQLDVHIPGRQCNAAQDCRRCEWNGSGRRGGAQIVDNMAGVLTSSSALTQYYGP